MSLINDALKRANQKPRDPQSSAPVPPMHPVESVPPSSRVLPWAVLILGVGVLAIAVMLWFRGGPNAGTKQVARNDSQSTAPAVSVVPENNTPVVQQQPAAKTAETEARAPVASPEPVKVAAAAPETKPAASIVSPVEKAPPANPSPETKTPELKVAAASPASPERKPTTSPEAHKTHPARLQAIYYRLRNPTVVLNGKTVSPGQSVDGIKVVSIQRTSVEVVQDGKYRTLTLQD
jgi:hypothetical protein